MRKTTLALGLGLALSLGAVDAAAQAAPARPDSVKAGQRGERVRGERAPAARGERGPRARGPRDGGLLRGITLTDAQQAQIRTLREQQRTTRGDSASRRQAVEALRAARQRGDTAAVRSLREQQRTQMTQQREREMAAIRAILTPEQRTRFDRNVAEMKERGERRRS